MVVRERLRAVSAIVVHHDSVGTVGTTVEDLLSNGIHPEHILIVDNSESDTVANALRAAIPPEIAIRTVPNHGYAAAVNFGCAHVSLDSSNEYMLVCTHEVRFGHGAIAALVETLDEVAVATCTGPTLMTGPEGDVIWSTGGRLSSILRRPSHLVDTVLAPDDARYAMRDWLDGAATMYRSEYVRLHPLPECYFLYMEEMDYHCAIRESGGVVAWTPGARAWQSTNGVPPYYLARNVQIFQYRWGRRGLRRCAAAYVIGRYAARSLLRRDRDALRQLSEGWAAGRTYLKTA